MVINNKTTWDGIKVSSSYHSEMPLENTNNISARTLPECWAPVPISKGIRIPSVSVNASIDVCTGMGGGVTWFPSIGVIPIQKHWRWRCRSHWPLVWVKHKEPFTPSINIDSCIDASVDVWKKYIGFNCTIHTPILASKFNWVLDQSKRVNANGNANARCENGLKLLSVEITKRPGKYSQPKTGIEPVRWLFTESKNNSEILLLQQDEHP